MNHKAILAAAAVVGMMSVGTQTRAETPTEVCKAQKKVPCFGAHGCSGKSACKSASNPKGKHHNSCAGHGFTCVPHAKACTSKGGKVQKDG